MTFEKAKKLLDGGFPIKHHSFGTLYAHKENKESIFINVGTAYKKVTVTNADLLYVLQPMNYVEEYKLLTSISQYGSTKDWEVVA